MLSYDPYYQIQCSDCGFEVKRQVLQWEHVIFLTLTNLGGPSQSRSSILEFIDKHWNLFWGKQKTTSWKSSVGSCLSSNPKFIKKEQNHWALSDQQPLLNERKIFVHVLLDGHVELELKKKEKRQRKKSDDDNESVDSNESKKRKIVGGIKIYPDVDNPAGDVKMSKQPTHTAPQVKIIDDYTVLNDKGYRLAKSTHGIWEGKWMFEVKINQHTGNLRIGWSQISGDLQGPCGYDQFSYSFRDCPGSLFHQSTRQPCPDLYLNGYSAGDTLSVCIHLPKLMRPLTKTELKYQLGDLPVDLGLLDRLWDPKKWTNYLPFPYRKIEPNPGSYIEYFLNGKPLGIAFQDLLHGKYHAAISAYMGASCTVNFGPDLKYPIEGYTPMSKASELPKWTPLLEKYNLAREYVLRQEKEARKGKKKAEIDPMKIAMLMNDGQVKSETSSLPATPGSFADSFVPEGALEEIPEKSSPINPAELSNLMNTPSAQQSIPDVLDQQSLSEDLVKQEPGTVEQQPESTQDQTTESIQHHQPSEQLPESEMETALSSETQNAVSALASLQSVDSSAFVSQQLSVMESQMEHSLMEPQTEQSVMESEQ
ncbi:hypothetical protein EDD86DRAFT_197412 [Gorgonomyces haynaldii]|nr:hypothetical protein EDD86DRAFT_197412 [Gorgonomyces haynaldii]